MRGIAELTDPAAGPLGRQPESVLDGHSDGAVQLMGCGDDDRNHLAQCHFRHRHGVVGLRAVEAVIGRRRHRKVGRCAGPFDLAGHRRQGVLHGLQRAQRTAELFALAGVSHRKFDGGVQCTDDLDTARPGAAPGEFDRGVDGDEGTRRQVGANRVTRLAAGVMAPRDRELIWASHGYPQLVAVWQGQHHRGGIRRVRH